eukprot:scaffold92668_cov21-Tisochrysis_lutea.AAC.1
MLARLSSLQNPALSEQHGRASWPVCNTSSIASEQGRMGMLCSNGAIRSTRIIIEIRDCLRWGMQTGQFCGKAQFE